MGEMPLTFPLPPASTSNAARCGSASSLKEIIAFRACYERYLECLEFCNSQSASPVVEAAAHFVLDFDIVARRALGPNQRRYRLFKSRFLQNASCESCLAEFKLDRWKLAVEMRTIEEHAGAAFKKAGLFPLAPYFGAAAVRQEKLAA